MVNTNRGAVKDVMNDYVQEFMAAAGHLHGSLIFALISKRIPCSLFRDGQKVDRRCLYEFRRALAQKEDKSVPDGSPF